jgi:hypothetical protein
MNSHCFHTEIIFLTPPFPYIHSSSAHPLTLFHLSPHSLTLPSLTISPLTNALLIYSFPPLNPSSYSLFLIYFFTYSPLLLTYPTLTPSPLSTHPLTLFTSVSFHLLTFPLYSLTLPPSPHPSLPYSSLTHPTHFHQ